MKKRILTVLWGWYLVFLTFFVQALQPLSDKDLSKVSGQAFITVGTSSYGDYQFTKVNLGMIVETLLNADLLKIGEFVRSADDAKTGDGTVRMADANGNEISGGVHDANNNGVYDADIIIENFALGNVSHPSGTSNVANEAHLASIVPFLLENPYIEIAQTGSGADERVAGVRVGFENAKGYISGDFISLTGSIAGEIEGKDVRARVLGFPLLVDFVTPFELVDGTNSDKGDGAINFSNAGYIKRASWFGVPNGTDIEATNVRFGGFIPIGTVGVTSTACDAKLNGISTNVNTCFPASLYESIYIGDPDVTSGTTEEQLNNGGAKGVFISLQTENVPWENLSGIGDARINTEKGAFLNISAYGDPNNPSYPINFTFDEAAEGLPRVATCVGRLKGC